MLINMVHYWYKSPYETRWKSHVFGKDGTYCFICRGLWISGV